MNKLSSLSKSRARLWLFPALVLQAFSGSAAPLLIRGATVFEGTAQVPRVADVLVDEEGRIAKVAPGLSQEKGMQVVDAQGLALLPGLLDLHTHWTPNFKPSALPQIANAYLVHGVTTVNDFHQAPEAYAPRRAWLDTIDAPSVRFTARISTPLGHGADWADEATTRWVNSPEAARVAVRAVVAYRPDLIKVFNDGWRYNNAPDNSSMDEPTLTALVDEAHAHALRVYTHTVTLARGKQAARAGVDVIAHSILDAGADAELVASMRQHGTYYAPTLAVYEPLKPGQKPPADADSPVLRQRQANFAKALANVATLHRGGVPIALGTDAGMPGTPHGEATLHELELLVRAGLTPAEALQAGTANSARAAGLDDRGTLEPGKRADLLLVSGKPWQDIGDIRNVRRVFVAGKQMYGPGTRTPAGNRATSLPPQPVAALVDDFERGDGRTALDTLRTDEADGGNDRSVQVTEVVDREGGGRALSLQARLSYKPEAYAGVVLPLTRGSVAPADLRGYRGLRFDVRGDVSRLRVEFRGLDSRRWTTEVSAAPGWRTIDIPFAQLQGQPPYRQQGQGPSWHGDDVLQALVIAQGQAGDKVWFELDDVRFY